MKLISIRNSIILTAVVSFALSGSSQTNSWTKSTSGSWHEPSWSLGVLPDANQSHIMVTNAGWKAVAIDRVTARDFPDSLNVPRLTVSSPTNTMNTLMLNFAGLQSPLRVASDFDLGSNSVLLTLSSALEVGNDFLVNGAVSHGDNSSVSASSLYVGNTSPGIYNFSNGLLSAGNVIVGHTTTGSVHQSGGRLSVTNRLSVGKSTERPFYLDGYGRFELTGGILSAATIQVGEGGGRLGPPGANGTFEQSGGTNLAGALLLGFPGADRIHEYIYILNDGLLMTSNTVIYGGKTSEYGGDGHFVQAGGLHNVDGLLAVAGFYGRSFRKYTAQYTLSGGVVRARALTIDFGNMLQSAGTNQVSGDLVIGREAAFAPSSFYGLNGGMLSTSNTVVLNSEHGHFGQSGGTHAVGNVLEIAGSSRSSSPGYTLSAGELSASDIRVSTNGAFTQSGGSATAESMTIAHGDYTMTRGDIAVSNILLGDGALGSFHQSGGRLQVASALALGQNDHRTFSRGTGQFTFAGGTLSSPLIRVGHADISMTADGVFVQSGGSNSVGRLEVGPIEARSGGDFIYNLNDGVLSSTNTVVNGYAEFLQAGGVHSVSGSLLVRGYENRTTPIFSSYTLSNGLLRSRSLTVGRSASFSQAGGTNAVEGDFIVGEDFYVGGSDYSLAGGALSTANTIVLGSHRGVITQDGGSHTVSETLDLQRPITYFSPQQAVAVRYALNSGQLTVRDIRVSTNAVFQHNGGMISHSGTIALEGGAWHGAPREQLLGGLKLAASITNSSLLLPDGPAGLWFANSAGVPWDAAATLVIHNWRGSTNGAGSHRILFGRDQTGLTSQQLAQIRFHNPAGLAAGDYSATILNSGEVVPLEPTGRGPAITYQQTAGQLRLEWPSGYTLQTSTNIVGPFEDVSASSPHSADTTADPRRFFRFRRTETP